MRRHAAASEPYCSTSCRFKAASIADERRIRRMGMVLPTDEELERIAPASTAPPRKSKRQRSERTITRDAKLLAELEAEMAEDLAIIRASRRATA
jgi:hypothetical protein